MQQTQELVQEETQKRRLSKQLKSDGIAFHYHETSNNIDFDNMAIISDLEEKAYNRGNVDQEIDPTE